MIAFEGDAGQEGDDIGLVSGQEVHEFGGRRSRGLAQAPLERLDCLRRKQLHDATLAFAIARRWSDVLSNALEPGWVPTKMGGTGAPDDMDQAHLTQAWLAAGDATEARVTGRYFYHLHPLAPSPQANDAALQDRLIAICAELSGVPFPA
jgi:hypothetical protein